MKKLISEAFDDFGQLLKEEHPIWVPFLFLFFPVWLCIAIVDKAILGKYS